MHKKVRSDLVFLTILSWFPQQARHVGLSLMSALSCTGCPVIVVFSWFSCPEWSVLAVLFWLSRFFCPVLTGQFLTLCAGCLSLAGPFWLARCGSHFLEVVFSLYCSYFIIFLVAIWSPFRFAFTASLLFRSAYEIQLTVSLWSEQAEQTHHFRPY